MNTIVNMGKDTKKIRNSKETGAKKLRGREWSDIGRTLGRRRPKAEETRREAQVHTRDRTQQPQRPPNRRPPRAQTRPPPRRAGRARGGRRGGRGRGEHGADGRHERTDGRPKADGGSTGRTAAPSADPPAAAPAPQGADTHRPTRPTRQKRQRCHGQGYGHQGGNAKLTPVILNGGDLGAAGVTMERERQVHICKHRPATATQM